MTAPILPGKFAISGFQFAPGGALLPPLMQAADPQQANGGNHAPAGGFGDGGYCISIELDIIEVVTATIACGTTYG